MLDRKIVLIGHSGAGKSATLQILHIDRALADMDVALNREAVPAKEALKWLSSSKRPPILVAYNHQTQLEAIQALKQSKGDASLFAGLWFLYLKKPVTELQMHLSLETAGGSTRDRDGVAYTLEHYEDLDHLYKGIADETVDCTGKSVKEVACEVFQISKAQQ